MECKYKSEEFLECLDRRQLKYIRLFNRHLRGGPKMKLPGNVNGRFEFSTDNRKKLVANFYVNGTTGFEKNSKNFNTGVEVTIKPSNFLVITINPGFNKSFSEFQYVTQTTYLNDDRYVFASIDRKTVSASFRVNFNL